jgi:hypothetical protein
MYCFVRSLATQRDRSKIAASESIANPKAWYGGLISARIGWLIAGNYALGFCFSKNAEKNRRGNVDVNAEPVETYPTRRLARD